MDKFYTIKEIAQELNIPESTVRFYRDKFADFIPAVGSGRLKRYKPEALDVLRLIALELRKGTSATDVEQLLSNRYSRFIDVPQEPQRSSAAVQQQTYITREERERELQSRERLSLTLEALADQKEKLLDLDRTDRELAEKNRELAEKNRELEQEFISLKERMNKLEEKEERRPWWKKLFQRDKV